MISLPRSQVEMTDWDQQWQDKISKVVRRVAKDLIANDEAEISEVVRRRLFEDLGSEKMRRNVAKAFGDWCFERRAQLPPEWTAVDTVGDRGEGPGVSAAPLRGLLSVPSGDAVGLPAEVAGAAAVPADARHAGDAGAVDLHRGAGRLTARRAPSRSSRSVRRRSTSPGSEAWCWASSASRGSWRRSTPTSPASNPTPARSTPTPRGAAGHPPARRHGDPLRVVRRADRQGRAPAGAAVRARRAGAGHDLDRQRRGRAGGQGVLHPRVGADGFKVYHKAKMEKVVHDRRASLDEETEIKPAMRKLVEDEFRRGASIPVVPFPADSSTVPDSPRLTLVVARPDVRVGRRRSDPRADRRVDEESRQVVAALPGRARLVPQEARARPARQGGTVARVAARADARCARARSVAEFERADHPEIQAKVTDAEEKPRTRSGATTASWCWPTARSRAA